jgi:hypothetical protein
VILPREGNPFAIPLGPHTPSQDLNPIATTGSGAYQPQIHFFTFIHLLYKLSQYPGREEGGLNEFRNFLNQRKSHEQKQDPWPEIGSDPETF